MDYSPLRRGLDALAESIAEARSHPDGSLRRVLRAGVVQSFEFTYELSWKFMRRWLVSHLSRDEVDGLSRRDLFRLAAREGLVSDLEAWLRFYEARNLTSHTYNEQTADEVFALAEPLYNSSVELYQKLTAGS